MSDPASDFPPLMLFVLAECLQIPDAVGDPDAIVRAAESLRDTEQIGAYKADPMALWGAALYRAGRYQENIARIEESIRMRLGRSESSDWAFLAMAHARLGRQTEAQRCFERPANYRAPEGPATFWDEQRVLLQRREAEAVVLYDPIFPADPLSPPE